MLIVPVSWFILYFIFLLISEVNRFCYAYLLLSSFCCNLEKSIFSKSQHWKKLVRTKVMVFFIFIFLDILKGEGEVLSKKKAAFEEINRRVRAQTIKATFLSCIVLQNINEHSFINWFSYFFFLEKRDGWEKKMELTLKVQVFKWRIYALF